MFKILLTLLLSVNIFLNASDFLTLKDSCSKGKMESCYRLGRMFSTGDNVRTDQVEAKKHYEKACKKNYARACAELGDMYERKIGVKKNMSKAIDLYSKACSLGNGEGCNYIGNIEEKSGHVEKYLKKYNEACQKRYPNACYYLGLKYEFGRVVAKNISTARQYYLRACEISKSYCGKLGEMYEEGMLGVKKDNTKARYYYEKSCKGNNAEGCYKAGNFYYYGKSVTINYKKAVAYYRKSCNIPYGASVEKGCNNLATMYYYGRGIKKNIAMAKKYYEKACDRGYSKACRQ